MNWYSVTTKFLTIQNINVNNVNFFRAANRKLTRAFSFSRTPRRAMQRAMNNLLSPSQNKSQESLKDESDHTSQTSTLTPSMSVTNLCTPQRNLKDSRMPSSSSLQVHKSLNIPSDDNSDLENSKNESVFNTVL